MLATRLAPDRIRPLVESLTASRAGLRALRHPRGAARRVRRRLEGLRCRGDAAEIAACGRRLAVSVASWPACCSPSANDFNPTNTRTSEDTERDLSERHASWFGEAISTTTKTWRRLWGFGACRHAARQAISISPSRRCWRRTRRVPGEPGHRHVAGQPQGPAAEAGGDDSLSQGHHPLLQQPTPRSNGPPRR